MLWVGFKWVRLISPTSHYSLGQCSFLTTAHHRKERNLLFQQTKFFQAHISIQVLNVVSLPGLKLAQSALRVGDDADQLHYDQILSC